ncbi:MAG: CAP domain-containing protein [Bacteroidota bacterium]
MKSLAFNILLLLIFIPIAANSQVSTSIINVENLNTKFLEYLLKQEIDSVRKSKGLDILINDSILYLASKDQSEYLSHKKELTHFQKENIEKFSPQDRVDFYGAINYNVGENVLYTPLSGLISDSHTGKTYDIKTYKDAACYMMLAWVNSPGHYANIITRSYDITGVSVFYDMKSNKLFAAQVFADVNPYYSYKNNPSLFPYELYNDSLVNRKFVSTEIKVECHKRHAFDIKKDDRKKKCCNSSVSVFNYNSISLYFINDTLYMGIYKRYLGVIKKFFKNKKDGVLLEFLDFDYTYSCNMLDNKRMPTRDNGGCIFNGVITRPVYKDSVLYFIDLFEKKNAKNKIKSDYTLVPLGKFPKSVLEKKIDINLLILQKNRLCSIIPSQGICGLLIESKIPKFKLTMDFDSLKYRPNIKAEKKEYKVWFEQNKIDIINSDTLKWLKKILDRDDLFVSKIVLNVFASVEGTEEINQSLYTKRAEKILDVFQKEQDSTINLEVNTKENWPLFKKQLINSDFKFLLEMDSCQIKDYVNVKENALKLEVLLAQQRYGQVLIYYKPKITNQNINYYAMSEFRKLCSNSKLDNTQQSRLKKVLSFLLYRCSTNKLNFDSVKCNISNDKRFYEENHQLLLYNLIYKKDSTLNPNQVNDSLKKYFFKYSLYENAKYNRLAYLINNRKVLEEKSTVNQVKDFLSVIKKMNFSKDTIRLFELYYHFRYLNDLYIKGWTFAKVKESLDFIYQYYKEFEPNDDLKYELSLYFISFKQLETSISYLEPLVQDSNFHKEAYILYLKLYDQLQMAGVKSNSEDLLIEAAEKLPTVDWCNLFIGPCNIRFQIFNNESLKSVYCAKCK